MDDLALGAQLERLLHTDPAACIQLARGLSHHAAHQAVKARYLIDAGIALRDLGALQQGTALFQARLPSHPAQWSQCFRLASALHALAELHWRANQPQASRRALAAARQHYRQLALQPAVPCREQARAWIWLGDLLQPARRWFEAYDCYQQALRCDPQNGVAQRAAVPIRRIAAAFNLIDPSLHVQPGSLSAYQQFVCQQRLMLALDGGACTALDGVPLRALVEVPAPMIIAFRQLQAAYRRARMQLFLRLQPPYLDAQASQALLHSATQTLLDQLAQSALRSLALSTPQRPCFDTAWFHPDRPVLILRAPIAAAIHAGNHGLQALTELAREPAFPSANSGQASASALAALQRCRAALFYFAQMLAQQRRSPLALERLPLHTVRPHPALHRQQGIALCG